MPDESSETCFIRIIDAVGDTVIGQSSQFVINKFGTPVKTGELVTNGSFVNNLHGWNTNFDGARGQTDIDDQMFVLSIDEPGFDLGTITLSQGNLPVLGGKEYTLSSMVFANGTRSMGIAVISESDSLILLDTTIELPAVQEKVSFNFTADSDAIARIEFHLGGSRAGVFLDDISFYTGEDPNPTIPVRTVQDMISLDRFTVTPAANGILFSLPEGTRGIISIFSLQGKLLHDFYADGSQLWNGNKRNGIRCARGNYIAALQSAGTRQFRQFLLQ